MTKTISAPARTPPPRRRRERNPLLQQGADGAPSILVVGAREGDCRVLVNLLRRARYRTTEVTDGAGALAAALRSPPDMVITRIRMPSMDGEELVLRMRMESSLSHIPVIFHSSPRRGRNGMRDADGPGVKTVIAKHSAPGAVFEAVVRLLGLAECPIPVAPVAPRGMVMSRVASPRERKLAACLGELRAFQEEIETLLEEGNRAAARRERFRALGASMDAAEAGLAGVQFEVASLLEIGMDLTGSGDPDSLVDLLTSTASEIMGRRNLIPGHLAPPPVPAAGRTVTLGLVEHAAIMSPPDIIHEVLDLAGAGRGSPDLDSSRGRIVGPSPGNRGREDSREFETPLLFAPADVATFRRILDTGMTVGTPGTGPRDPDGMPTRVSVRACGVATSTGMEAVIEGIALVPSPRGAPGPGPSSTG